MSMALSAPESGPDTVPVFRPAIAPTALERIQCCIASGWLGYGPMCKELEGRFTARGGHALATANCTVALHLAARLVARPDRRRVLVPAMTFVSSAMAFAYAGLDVELVDIEPATGLIDPLDLERRIGTDCCAVVAVHLYGQRVDCAPLRQLCNRFGVQLIEDCAHRLDLLDPGPPLGDFACYSFNAVKEAPGGEAGLLWCREDAAMERARRLSNLGMTVDTPTRVQSTSHRDYAFGDEPGLKLRGSDLSAALVLANLDELAATRAVRAQTFAMFDAVLACGGPLAAITRSADDSYLMYVAQTDSGMRETLRNSLASSGIATSVHYPSLSRHPAFAKGSLPFAEQFDARIVTLPCFAGMSSGDARRVATALAGLAVAVPVAG